MNSTQPTDSLSNSNIVTENGSLPPTHHPTIPSKKRNIMVRVFSLEKKDQKKRSFPPTDGIRTNAILVGTPAAAELTHHPSKRRRVHVSVSFESTSENDSIGNHDTEKVRCCSEKRRNATKRVRFAPSQTISDPSPPLNLSDAEHKKVWYSKCDLLVIRKLNQSLIRAIRSPGCSALSSQLVLGDRHGDDEAKVGRRRCCSLYQDVDCLFCLRGLEGSLSVRAHLLRQNRISTGLCCVLGEQRRQQVLGVCDPQALRVCSQKMSSRSAAIAQTRASDDAVVAASIHAST